MAVATVNPVISHVRIVWDVDCNEFIVKAYNADKKRLPDCDYFTNDRQDAEVTGRMMVAGHAG